METRIRHAFATLQINLTGDAKAYGMTNSATNQYTFVKDVHGQEYLIRKNGKLWPPFTRAAENRNLKTLHRYGIYTSVIFNDVKYEFQICYLYPVAYRLNAAEASDKTLKLIGENLRVLHRLSVFDNIYCLPATVAVAFKKSKKSHDHSYNVIQSMLAVLQTDTANQVSSHNDLLPSSVYCKNNVVAFVDCEYSARNHRSYDVAFFFLNTFLTYKQEQLVLAGYDPNNTCNMGYYMFLMKPVVGFLLLQWSLAKHDEEVTTRLSQSLVTHLRDAAFGLPIKKHVAAQEEKELILRRKAVC